MEKSPRECRENVLMSRWESKYLSCLSVDRLFVEFRRMACRSRGTWWFLDGMRIAFVLSKSECFNLSSWFCDRNFLANEFSICSRVDPLSSVDKSILITILIEETFMWKADWNWVGIGTSWFGERTYVEFIDFSIISVVYGEEFSKFLLV